MSLVLKITLLLIPLLVSSFAHASVATERYFVGLWSKLETQDRERLSWALRSDDDVEMFAGVEQVQEKVSESLLRDREQLSAWVKSRGLTEQIKVLEIPANGSFVLFDASEQGLAELKTAISSGDLPQVFAHLGH